MMMMVIPISYTSRMGDLGFCNTSVKDVPVVRARKLSIIDIQTGETSKDHGDNTASDMLLTGIRGRDIEQRNRLRVCRIWIQVGCIDCPQGKNACSGGMVDEYKILSSGRRDGDKLNKAGQEVWNGEQSGMIAIGKDADSGICITGPCSQLGRRILQLAPIGEERLRLTLVICAGRMAFIDKRDENPAQGAQMKRGEGIDKMR